MASYSAPIACPASSSANYSIRLAAGEFASLSVDFPDGCNGLAKVTLLMNEVQIFPSDASQYYSGNGRTVQIDAAKGYPIQTGTILRIHVENIDDTYAHTPTVNIEIREPNQRLGDRRHGNTALASFRGKEAPHASLRGFLAGLFRVQKRRLK